MPNFSVMADNMRFWAENNGEGVLTNAAYQSEGAERDVMRTWVEAKLMWNPSLDVCELMEEFITGYYQGDMMDAFIERLLDLAIDLWW